MLELTCPLHGQMKEGRRDACSTDASGRRGIDRGVSVLYATRWGMEGYAAELCRGGAGFQVWGQVVGYICISLSSLGK